MAKVALRIGYAKQSKNLEWYLNNILPKCRRYKAVSHLPVCRDCTQPDRTLFFLIITYLRGISHWNSRDYASNVAIFHFLKPETNKGDFRLYFESVEKSCRGRHHSEILKTNTKTLIYSIWIRPQGSLGCQKVRQGPLNMPFEVWCANIAPKLKNIWNTLRKQGFFDIFFQFWQFFKVCAFFGQY